ncbi:MAG: YqeG family HAD IIIA-type phosphatase [Bacilli bacterium]
MENYIPDIYKKSIYDVDYKKLKKIGIKCLLIDLDNTIIAKKNDLPTQKDIDLFNKIKELGFKVIIFSNGFKRRIKKSSDILKVEFISFAQKPASKNYLKVMDKYSYKETEVAIIGDQLKTDILGGNKVGITTILVKPISKKDMFLTLFNRFLENRIFKKLSKKDLLRKGRYYE